MLSTLAFHRAFIFSKEGSFAGSSEHPTALLALSLNVHLGAFQDTTLKIV